jgi:4-oxalocrotonate tautomerase
MVEYPDMGQWLVARVPPPGRSARRDNGEGEKAMPLVIVKMLEGRSVEQKRRLVRELTDLIVKYTGTTEDQVDVLIEDYARENWAKAGVLFRDR